MSIEGNMIKIRQILDRKLVPVPFESSKDLAVQALSDNFTSRIRKVSVFEFIPEEATQSWVDRYSIGVHQRVTELARLINASIIGEPQHDVEPIGYGFSDTQNHIWTFTLRLKD